MAFIHDGPLPFPSGGIYHKSGIDPLDPYGPAFDFGKFRRPRRPSDQDFKRWLNRVEDKAIETARPGRWVPIYKAGDIVIVLQPGMAGLSSRLIVKIEKIDFQAEVDPHELETLKQRVFLTWSPATQAAALMAELSAKNILPYPVEEFIYYSGQ